MADSLDCTYSNQWYEYRSFAAAAEDERMKPIALEAQEHCRNLGVSPDKLKFYFFSPETNLATNEIISRIVHDLKNPLAVIRGLSQLANLKLNPDNKYNYFDNIIKQIDRLDQMVSDLLAVFRVEKLLNLSPVCMIQEKLETVKALSQSKNIQIIFTYDTDFKIPLYQKLFEQTVRSLIFNTVLALPPRSKLLISCQQKRSNMILSITPAIPDSDSENESKSLDLFVNEKLSQPGFELFLASHCAQIHNGKLWIENIPQKGISLYMSLPALKSLSQQ